jgi:hypothetical protein
MDSSNEIEQGRNAPARWSRYKVEHCHSFLWYLRTYNCPQFLKWATDIFVTFPKRLCSSLPLYMLLLLNAAFCQHRSLRFFSNLIHFHNDIRCTGNIYLPHRWKNGEFTFIKTTGGMGSLEQWAASHTASRTPQLRSSCVQLFVCAVVTLEADQTNLTHCTGNSQCNSMT